MDGAGSNRQYEGFSYPTSSPTTKGAAPYFPSGASPGGLVRRTNATGAPASSGSAGGYDYFYPRPASSTGGFSGKAGSEAGSTQSNPLHRNYHQQNVFTHPQPTAGGGRPGGSVTGTTAVAVDWQSSQSVNSRASAGGGAHGGAVGVELGRGDAGSVASESVSVHGPLAGQQSPGSSAGGSAQLPRTHTSTQVSFLPSYTSGDAAAGAVAPGGARPYPPPASPFLPAPPAAGNDGFGSVAASHPATLAFIPSVAGGSATAATVPPPSGPYNPTQYNMGVAGPAAPAGPAVSRGFFKDMMGRLLSDLDGDENSSNGGTVGSSSSEPRPLYQTRFGCPEDDLPLLEELGVFPGHIWRKARAVLHPFRPIPLESVEDMDLAGPVVFAVCLALLLSLQGKIQFSAIYGLCVLGVLLFKALLALMRGVPGAECSVSSPIGTASLQFIISCLGYALLPSLLLAGLRTAQYWIATSFSTVLLPLALVVVAWSSWCATSLVVRGLGMEPQRYLILYPMVLFYSSFAALTIF